MKFSNAIAFIVVNLAISATALAVHQTEVITFTQTVASGDASPVVEKRQDLRSTGFTIEGRAQPTPAAAVDMSEG